MMPPAESSPDGGTGETPPAESSPDGGTGEAPVPSPCHRVNAEVTTAASSNPTVEELADKRWKDKGKWLVMEEGHSPDAAAAATSDQQPPPQEKLMQDGIRRARRFHFHAVWNGATEDAGTSGVHRVKEEADGDAGGGVVAPPAQITTFDGLDVSAAVRDRLRELGATEPKYVYGKKLESSDVRRGQNRLFFSCKKKEYPTFPITKILTKKEELRVKDVQNGMNLTTFDRTGNEYTLKCKYLDSNGGYRYITQWRQYLQNNSYLIHNTEEFTRRVNLELWWFRSPNLPPLQGGDEEAVQRGGSLGLVLINYEGRGGNADGGRKHLAKAKKRVKGEEPEDAGARKRFKKANTKVKGEEPEDTGARKRFKCAPEAKMMAPAVVKQEEPSAAAAAEQWEAWARGMTREPNQPIAVRYDQVPEDAGARKRFKRAKAKVMAPAVVKQEELSGAAAAEQCEAWARRMTRQPIAVKYDQEPSGEGAEQREVRPRKMMREQRARRYDQEPSGASAEQREVRERKMARVKIAAGYNQGPSAAEHEAPARKMRRVLHIAPRYDQEASAAAAAAAAEHSEVPPRKMRRVQTAPRYDQETSAAAAEQREAPARWMTEKQIRERYSQFAEELMIFIEITEKLKSKEPKT